MAREPKGYCDYCGNPFYDSGPHCSACNKAIAGVDHNENKDRQRLGVGKNEREDYFNAYEDALNGNLDEE